MVKLVVAVAGQPDRKGIAILRRKIAQYFPSISELSFVRLDKKYYEKNLESFDFDLHDETARQKRIRTLTKFRKDITKRKDTLICILICKTGPLGLGIAYPHIRVSYNLVAKPLSKTEEQIGILHEIGHLFGLVHEDHFKGKRIVRPCIMAYTLPKTTFLRAYSSTKLCDECERRVAAFK